MLKHYFPKEDSLLLKNILKIEMIKNLNSFYIEDFVLKPT